MDGICVLGRLVEGDVVLGGLVDGGVVLGVTKMLILNSREKRINEQLKRDSK